MAMYFVNAEIQFEPRDIWVGLYWTKDIDNPGWLFVYICLLPMLPIKLDFYQEKPNG